MARPQTVAIILVAILVVAGVIVYFALPGGQGGKQLTPLKVGETYTSTSTAYLQAGIQDGYFSKYGLNVSTIRFSSVTLLVAALLKGDVQLALGTAGDVAFFDAAGGNARIIATYAQHVVFSVVAPDNYTTAQSLVGKVAVVTSTAGSDYLAIALMLNASGIKPTALHYLPGGSSVPARLSLVENGEGQVTAVIPDYLPLLKGTSLHVIANASAFPEHVAWDTVYGLDPYLTANRKTIDSFMLGLNETHTWFTTNRTGASQVINSYLKLGNLSQAEATWDAWQPAWSASIRPDLAGVKNYIGLISYFNPTLSSAVPSGMVDVSYYNDTLHQ
ncbi:MAG: ABC transporter substrate-binding protein [Thaumarchaeota archaeon]|nr:ABC transporter substrate-binding protein [Nitrososphaerota archaeon]